MNKYQNEQGAALVLTLLLITLITLLLLGQFYQVTNTAGQVATMEKNIESRHLAEMGVEYYQQLIASKQAELTEAAQASGFQGVEEKLQEWNGTEVLTVQVEGERKYFTIENVTLDQQTENEIIVEFTSLGTANGKEVRENNEIIITIMRNK
ncbi:hypothetical protein ACLIBH_06120 [Virgibacillus sp. W0430]|uniref:hypothetical protein n=1 Tax=Virgibacillus sp. W0430 TaxID=3391580 RepID=UPI003F46D3FF